MLINYYTFINLNFNSLSPGATISGPLYINDELFHTFLAFIISGLLDSGKVLLLFVLKLSLYSCFGLYHLYISIAHLK